MVSAKAANRNEEHLCFEICVADAEAAEILAAEVFEAGTTGIEERESTEGVRLLLYAPVAAEAEVQAAIVRAAPGVRVGAPQRIAPADWSEQWKLGLKAAEISPRLLVRPSFVVAAPKSGQFELIIDPGQAFGTGGHPSTHLSLEWIDALHAVLDSHNPGWRVLDVGTGTGVLSLAALRFGAAFAFAFDLDPLAAEATCGNARANGLESGLEVFVGPLEAVAAETFDLVVANLLRTELMPLIDGIASRVRPGGHAVFSGLLSSECEPVIAAAQAANLSHSGVREMPDANGDVWVALLMTR
jgi:ribosomal protein L11 methyltransferase